MTRKKEKYRNKSNKIIYFFDRYKNVCKFATIKITRQL